MSSGADSQDRLSRWIRRNWKFSMTGIAERQSWDDYTKAYEDWRAGKVW